MTQSEGAQAKFSLDVEVLRTAYFRSQPRLPTDVVSRKIWMAIRQNRRSGSTLEEKDIHQSAYTAVLANFTKIVTRFAMSRREPTQSNFEAWLTICIRNLVVDTMRQQPPTMTSIESLTGTELPVQPPDNSAQQMRMHLLFVKACECLTPIECEIVEKRLAEREKPAALAARYNLNTQQIYKLLYEAKLRLRNELIRIIAEERLNSEPALRARYSALIHHRCSLKRPCYFYLDPCRLAYVADVLAAAHEDLSAEDASNREQEAANLVRALLDDWNLPSGLDRCYWAAIEGRGKTEPSPRITS